VTNVRNFTAPVGAARQHDDGAFGTAPRARASWIHPAPGRPRTYDVGALVYGGTLEGGPQRIALQLSDRGAAVHGRIPGSHTGVTITRTASAERRRSRDLHLGGERQRREEPVHRRSKRASRRGRASPPSSQALNTTPLPLPPQHQNRGPDSRRRRRHWGRARRRTTGARASTSAAGNVHGRRVSHGSGKIEPWQTASGAAARLSKRQPRTSKAWQAVASPLRGHPNHGGLVTTTRNNLARFLNEALLKRRRHGYRRWISRAGGRYQNYG